MHATVMEGFKPDLTILFDIDPILTQKRVKTRGGELSRFDTETLEFHKKLRKGFLDIAENEPKRVKTIDAALSRDAIAAQIRHIAMKQFEGLRLG